MPKVNFRVPFLSGNGQPVYEPVLDYSNQLAGPDGQIQTAVKKDEDGNTLTRIVDVADVVVSILHDNYEGDMVLPGSERIKRHRLAERVFAATGEDEYSIEELHLIQDLAAKKRPTLVLGRLDEVINR